MAVEQQKCGRCGKPIPKSAKFAAASQSEPDRVLCLNCRIELSKLAKTPN